MKKYYIIVHANSELPGYWGEAPQLPGCFSRGDTMEDLLTNAREAIELYLEDSDMEGTDILDTKKTASRRECSVSEKQSCVLEKVLTKRKAALDALAKY